MGSSARAFPPYVGVPFIFCVALDQGLFLSAFFFCSDARVRIKIFFIAARGDMSSAGGVKRTLEEADGAEGEEAAPEKKARLDGDEMPAPEVTQEEGAPPPGVDEEGAPGEGGVPGVSDGQDPAIAAAAAAAAEAAAAPVADDMEMTSNTMDCPPGLVGRVIGKGGETIKGLQAQSGAHITIDQNFPEGHPRKISITGPKVRRRELDPGSKAPPGIKI